MKIYSLEEIKKLSENGNFNKENNCKSQNKCENSNDKINYEDDNAQINYENNFGYSLAEFDNAKTKILKYVLYKKRSENEIIKKFENEFDLDLIQAVVSDLKEKGYVNDANYIKRSVNEFMALRNLYEKSSAKKITQKKFSKMEEIDIKKYLMKKGYKSDSIKEALNEY